MTTEHDPPTAPPFPARPLGPDAMAALLRAAVGLPHWAPVASEQIAAMGCPLARPLESVEPEAWIAWSIVGLYLFGTPTKDTDMGLPPPPAVTLRTVEQEARRILVVLTMLRVDGNLSYAAQALRTSRRSLRCYLRASGLYPWHDAMRSYSDLIRRERVDATDDDTDS